MDSVLKILVLLKTLARTASSLSQGPSCCRVARHFGDSLRRSVNFRVLYWRNEGEFDVPSTPKPNCLSELECHGLH